MMHIRHYFLRSALLLIIFISPVITFSAGLHTVDYNYINDFIGGRATGMAGAYTAISDDPSGIYYNPAGLVFAYDNQISLSVNSFKSKNIKMNNAVGNNPYTQDSFTFYPSFFGLVQSLGKLKVGATFLTLNNEILDQDDYFPDVFPGTASDMSFRINYNITDSTLMFGLGIAGYITDSFSWGVTVLGFRRESQQIANMVIQYFNAPGNTTYEYSNTYITEFMTGAIGKIGVQYMPFSRLSAGYSFTYGTVISHERDDQVFYKPESGTGNMEDPGYVSGTSSKEYKNSRLPMTHRLGFAFFPNNKIVISADVIADLGTRYYQEKVENTFNYAIGSEFFVTPSFPVRFGIFTNFANTPSVNKNYANQQMHVDLYGASASFGWQTKNSSISVCGYYQYGKGDSQIIADTNSTQETIIQMYSISLTGSAKY